MKKAPAWGLFLFMRAPTGLEAPDRLRPDREQAETGGRGRTGERPGGSRQEVDDRRASPGDYHEDFFINPDPDRTDDRRASPGDYGRDFFLTPALWGRIVRSVTTPPDCSRPSTAAATSSGFR